MTLLVVLTVIEIVLLVAVLAAYLVAIHRRLRRINRTLGKIAFGVRAVESQTASIGPSVVALNEELEATMGVVVPLVERAERATT